MNYRVILHEAPVGRCADQVFGAVESALRLTRPEVERRHTGPTVWLAEAPDRSTAESIRVAFTSAFGLPALVVPSLTGPDRGVASLAEALRKAGRLLPRSARVEVPVVVTRTAPVAVSVEVFEGGPMPQIPPKPPPAAAPRRADGRSPTVMGFEARQVPHAVGPRGASPSAPFLFNWRLGTTGAMDQIPAQDAPPAIHLLMDDDLIEAAQAAAAQALGADVPSLDWDALGAELDLEVEVVAPHDARYGSEVLNPGSPRAGSSGAPEGRSRLAAAGKAAWKMIGG